MVLGSSGERLDIAICCLTEEGAGMFRERRESWIGKNSTKKPWSLYLSALPVGQSSPLGRWQRSGHSLGSRARPFRWPRRHGCSPSSVPRRYCGMVWSSCRSGTGRPALSSLPDGSQGSTPHSAGRGWHWEGGTLPPIQPPYGSGGPGCLGI